MGGCSAPFCNNSSKKGYVMKVFPKCPERRALWLQNIPRENWVPTDNCCLCEIHFSTEMWEQRADHKRKLKPNAVPTIFGFFIKKKEKENEKEVSQLPTESSKESQTNINDVCNINTQSTVCTSSVIVPDKQNCETKDNIKDCQIINDISEPSISATYISLVDKSNKDKKYQDGRSEEIVQRQQLSLIKMKKKLKVLRSTVQILKDKISNDKYKKALSSVFTEDQIKVLFTKRRNVRSWSNETIKRALQLKFVCGVNGYKEIIRQGIPLPSLRTLRRRLE